MPRQDEIIWITNMVAISGRVSPNQLEIIGTKHILDVIINLDEESHSFERNMAKKLQIDYKFENIVGYSTPTHQQLTKVVGWIRSSVSQGKKVLVHCSKGSGRSPTVISAFLISEGMTTDDALRKIKMKKNTAFNYDKVTTRRINALRQFEKRIRQQKLKSRYSDEIFG